MLDSLSAIALVHRHRLLAAADEERAIEVVNDILPGVLDAFNDANTSVATSLLARMLFARAVIGVAHAWLNDLAPNSTAPETYRALLSIVTDPPVNVNEVCYKEGETPDAG